MFAVINLAITMLGKMTIYPTEKVFDSTGCGIIFRYTIVSLCWPMMFGFVVGYRRGFFYEGTWGFVRYGAVGALLAPITYLLVSKRGVSGIFRFCFKFLGFVMSFLWLFMLSDMVVSIIVTLNVLFNYQYSFMMISVFSFWAWLPHTIGSIKLVRLLKSMPNFGGIIFDNFLIFGLASLIEYFRKGESTIVIWPESNDKSAIQLGAYLYLNGFLVILTMILVSMRGLRYTRILGLLLVAIFLIATVATFILGFFVERIN